MRRCTEPVPLRGEQYVRINYFSVLLDDSQRTRKTRVNLSSLVVVIQRERSVTQQTFRRVVAGEVPEFETIVVSARRTVLIVSVFLREVLTFYKFR